MTIFDDTLRTKAASETVTLRTYEDVHAAKDRLQRVLDWALQTADPTAAADFVGVLEETINTIDFAGYETIPTSIGMGWLHANIEVFAQMYSRLSDPEPVWFFRRILGSDNGYLFSLLYSAQLLNLIGDEYREGFIRDLFAKLPPEGNDWIKNLLKAGISRDDIAEMILQRLADTEIDPRYNYPHFVGSFLRYGAGRIERGYRDYHYLPDGRSAWWFENFAEVTMWSLLSDDQLVEALRICEAKLPGTLFHKLDNSSPVIQLQARLMDRNTDDEQLEAGRQRIEDLLIAAAAALTPAGFRNASIETLALLPVAEQRKLLVRLEGGSIRFLISLASQVDDGRELFDKYIASLSVTQGVGPQLYSWVLSYLKEVTNRELADHIADTLVVNLRHAGYNFGIVTEGIVPSGRRKGCRRDQVVINGMTYVHNSASRDYYPKVGDQVIFYAKGGRVLTPRVLVVTFTPVPKEGAK
ncbi:MAG: hypothetical protein ACQR33_05675 [Candidatus Saccharibacteria bacterium]